MAPYRDCPHAGRQTIYTYDAFGNVTQVTRLAGTSHAVTTQMTYTPDYSQLASITDLLGHTTTLSYTNGCLHTITDPQGHTPPSDATGRATDQRAGCAGIRYVMASLKQFTFS